jgi:hypothetical protein
MSDIVERLNGQGRVLIDDREVAHVTYSIDVTQEYVDTSSMEGRSRIPGMKSASGQLQIFQGPIDLEMAQEWTLVLSDGRRCHCILSHVSLPSGPYTFTVSGPIG